MTLRHSLALACTLFASLACGDASAAYFYGKFDYATTDYNDINRLRYRNTAANLSIYVTDGPNAALLQAAYMHKAPVDVTYAVISCPPGVSGTCGTIVYLNVSAFSIP